MKGVLRYLPLFVACALTLLAGCFQSLTAQSNISPEQLAEIRATISGFTKALRTNDVAGFRTLLSDGLVVIRNFVTGGNGSRGNDLRFYRSVNEFSSSISIPVKGEESIDFRNLFAGSIGSKFESFHIVKVSGTLTIGESASGRTDPPTSKIVETCQKMRSAKYPDDFTPMIMVLSDREFVLTESSLILDLPVGSWAFFSKVGNQYFLRAIFDFR